MSLLRLEGLPTTFRRELKAARTERAWSQAELGRRVGLPQAHISGIETGKIVPRFDTLLEIVRILEWDLVLVPRSLVPVVNTLVREHRHHGAEEPLYAVPDDEDDEERRRDEL